MKEPNYLKTYNWTIVKIIIVCDVKKNQNHQTCKGRPSNIKTVCWMKKKPNLF